MVREVEAQRHFSCQEALLVFVRSGVHKRLTGLRPPTKCPKRSLL